MKKMQPLIRVVLSGALFIVVLLGLKNALAGVRTVRRASRFDSAISKDLVAALFYVEERGMDKGLRKKIKIAKRSFRDVSKTNKYKYAGVNFIYVNTKKEELAGVADRHRVASPKPNSPTVALFRGGRLVTSARGFLSSLDVSKMIDNYFGAEIEKVTKEKERELSRRKEDAKRRAYERSHRYPYGDGYYGYGWPWYRRWWGGPYYRYHRYYGPYRSHYYHSPGFGFGIGFGHYGRRRCHRCH